jgi:hypothetical protein
MENQYESKTDLMTTKLEARPCGSPDDEDDIYWYATPQKNFVSDNAVGDWICKKATGGRFPWSDDPICNRGRIRWAEEKFNEADDAKKWNIACHEIGHAVGFSHGDTGNNCMDEGDNGIIDQHMIDEINNYY